MAFEGDLGVLDAFIQRHQDPLHPNAPRTALHIGPGGGKGVLGGARAMALEQKCADGALLISGCSAGAATTGFHAAKLTELGTRIFPGECATPEFFDFGRLLRGLPAMDIDYLVDTVFRKKLDIGALRGSLATLVVMATKRLTGETTYFNLKEMDDPLQGIKASLAAPGASHGRVTIHGEEYVDGAASPFPLQPLIEEHGITDLLVFMNRGQAYREKNKRLIDFLMWALDWELPATVRRSLEIRAETARQQLDWIRHESNVRWLFCWDEGPAASALSTFRFNRQKLLAAMAEAFEDQLHQFRLAGH